MTDEGPAPPAVGVNVIVAENIELPLNRSEAAIVSVTVVTVPPMTPDDTESDIFRSKFVNTFTVEFPAVTKPMVRPASVTVTAVLAASAAPPVVMKMDVAPGAPEDRVAPLADSVAVGVAVVAKKPKGKYR